MPDSNLRYEDVKKAAEDFLNKYHSTNSIPIPIEDIVERQMRIAVSAVPGIKYLLGVDAFINSDFNQITIDSDSFQMFPERSRFSIAHEIGHLILHKDWYKKYGPKDIGNYNDIHDSIDPELLKFMEIQAYTFAGLVLVPYKLLIEIIKERLHYLPSLEHPEILAPYIQDLPVQFQVSDVVILRRLQNEKIVKKNI